MRWISMSSDYYICSKCKKDILYDKTIIIITSGWTHISDYSDDADYSRNEDLDYFHEECYKGWIK